MLKEEQTFKKKKLWKNLFLLNLCISLLLIGIYWVPVKMVQLENFVASPSVNLPKEGVVPISSTSLVQPSKGSTPSNLLETKLTVINASSEKNWVYFDFSRGGVVKIHDKT
ncbi:MAG TPA: hypothetical protein EYG21_07090, partial [Nitrospinaceae bacterium]|nr:hypothetical protein [Nitrospinaceae bacterium]